MNTRNYFDLGIKFARVKASVQLPKEDQDREFSEFITSCKVLGIVEPNSFKELLSMNSYSERFVNPLPKFKTDLFRTGVLVFSIFLLQTSSTMKMYRTIKEQGLDIEIDISDILVATENAGKEMLSCFHNWKLNKEPLEVYLKEVKENPSSAFKTLIKKIHPILEKYINEDDLPKNWKQKIDRAFDLKLSALGVSVDLNYILKKWLRN